MTYTYYLGMTAFPNTTEKRRRNNEYITSSTNSPPSASNHQSSNIIPHLDCFTYSIPLPSLLCDPLLHNKRHTQPNTQNGR